MRPYTTDTHGRNHYFHAPKEHKVPKRSKSRCGTRTSVRQKIKCLINNAVKLEMEFVSHFKQQKNK